MKVNDIKDVCLKEHCIAFSYLINILEEEGNLRFSNKRKLLFLINYVSHLISKYYSNVVYKRTILLVQKRFV